jgi:NADPH-dependent 2,4-dienoyl-CoA reductase/sulfur reductase-like enzyme
VAERIEADVAIVGAGPAGIAAACLAAESGRRAVLLDEAPAAGGQIWRHAPPGAPPARAATWLDRLRRCGATLLDRAVVADAELGLRLTAERAGRAVEVRAPAIVLATGARELFLPFPGWTLPGVLGVGAAQALLKAGTSFARRRVVVAGTGPLLLPVAAALSGGGARVLLVAEQASFADLARFALGLVSRPGKLVEAAAYRAAFAATPFRTSSFVAAAEGDGRVERVRVRQGGSARTLECDVLCSGFGLVPNLELPRLLGCAIEGGFVAVDDRQRTSVPGVLCAGEPTGIGGVDLALAEGELAGLTAVGQPVPGDLVRRRDRERGLVPSLARAFALRPELRGLAGDATLVCRCEDVALASLRPFGSAREAKLASRCGMGACQGRVCGPATEFLFGWSSDSVRPPLKPVSLETLEDAS